MDWHRLPPGPLVGSQDDPRTADDFVPVQGRLARLPPRFTDAAAERRHRKLRLAGALRILAHQGYEDGVAGHISVRDPERTHCFWVNPLGVSFHHVRPDDLVLLDRRGNAIQGRHHINDAAFAVHAAIHAARPDVTAAVHAHTPHGKALAATGMSLEPLTQDACAFYRDHSVYERYTGLIDTLEDAVPVAAALAGRKALILRNHGLLTVADTVDAAVWWLIAMERCCATQLAAKAAGTTIPVPPDAAALTHRQIGNPLVGWLSFQPLWDTLKDTDPDLFL